MYYFKNRDILYPVILTVLIIIHLLGTIHVYAQPEWARPGIYVEYSKKIIVSKTDAASMVPELSERLNGYMEERAKYVITDVSGSSFTMEKILIGGVYDSGTPELRKYINATDYGELNTIRSQTTVYLVFEWYFSFRQYKMVIDDGLVIIKPIFIYLDPLNPGIDNINYDKNIDVEIGNQTADVYIVVKASYDTDTGLLKEFSLGIKYSVNGLPAITITYTIERVSSNVPRAFGIVIDLETMISLIAGGLLAAIIAVGIYYYRVKKSLGV